MSNHNKLDVIFGFVLGALITATLITIFSIYQKQNHQKSQNQIQITQTHAKLKLNNSDINQSILTLQQNINNPKLYHENELQYFKLMQQQIRLLQKLNDLKSSN